MIKVYVFIVLACLVSLPAYAACTSPNSLAGSIIYNSDHRAMQYCNGSKWISFPRMNDPGLTGPNWGAVTTRTELTTDDAVENDMFPTFISLDGDVMAFGNSEKEGGRGAAYVFKYDGVNWNQVDRLILSGTRKVNDFFGTSVSVDGNNIAVGATQNNSVKGSVTIFTYNGTIWPQSAYITSTDSAESDFFGYRVSLKDDRILIGARQNNDNRGAAYIFKKVGASWTQEAKLTANDAAVGDYFSEIVHFNGTHAFVGTNYKNNNAGAVYIFAQVGGVWQQVSKFTPDANAEKDYFGKGLHEKDGWLLVGAPGENSTKGAVYAYKYNGSAYVFHSKFSPPSSSYFGASISIDNGRAVIAEWPSTTRVSRVYIYKLVDDTWVEEGVQENYDGVTADYFGYRVAISGETIFIGTPYKNSNKGVVYVVNPDYSVPPPKNCSGPNGTPGDWFYNSDHGIIQYCDGYRWVSTGPLNTGQGSGNCANPSGSPGSIIFNKDICALQYCNGTNWILIGKKVPSACN